MTTKRGRKVNPSNVYQGSNGSKTVFVIATEGNKQARRLCAQKIGCCEYELVFCMKSTAERAIREGSNLGKNNAQTA